MLVTCGVGQRVGSKLSEPEDFCKKPEKKMKALLSRVALASVLMGASVMAMAPIFALFFSMQKRVIEGLASSGIKG